MHHSFHLPICRRIDDRHSNSKLYRESRFGSISYVCMGVSSVGYGYRKTFAQFNFVCESISNHRCYPPWDRQSCFSSPDSVRKPHLAIGKCHESPHRGTNNVNLTVPSPSRQSTGGRKDGLRDHIHLHYPLFLRVHWRTLRIYTRFFHILCFLFRSSSDPFT
jgi:hypothetical protein